MVKRHGCCLLLMLLGGCGEPEPGAVTPLESEVIPQAIQAHAALRDAVDSYAAARTPEQVKACLPALEKVAEDTRQPQFASRARFAIAHAYAYALNDRTKAIEQFQQVIAMAPTAPLATLAARQIEELRRRGGEATP